MSVDGRGTGFRGDNFMDVVYRQLGLYETVDQIRAARCGALIVGLEKDYTLFACYATCICTYICVETTTSLEWYCLFLSFMYHCRYLQGLPFVDSSKIAIYGAVSDLNFEFANELDTSFCFKML